MLRREQVEFTGAPGPSLAVHEDGRELRRNYVLIDPRRVSVEVFTREDDGWRLRRYGRDDVVELRALTCTLSVRDLHARVPGIDL